MIPVLRRTTKPPTGTRPDFSHALMRGLVGWWPMLEHGGVTVYDYSGHGNNGTLTNGPLWATGNPRFAGAALSLDGSDDYVAIASIETPRVTVAAWVNIDGRGTQSILQRDGVNGGPRIWQFYVDATPRAVFLYFNNSGNIDYTATAIGISDSTWHHIVATYDAVNARLYVDGIASGSPSGLGGDLWAGGEMGIGGPFTSVSGLPTMLGKVDDVRLYNRALSAGEVWELYRNPWQMFLGRSLAAVKAAAAVAFMTRRGILIQQAVNRASTY